MLTEPVTKDVLSGWSKDCEAFNKDRQVTDNPEARALLKRVQQRRKEVEHESESIDDDGEGAR